jgi:PEP-CTERM motif
MYTQHKTNLGIAAAIAIFLATPWKMASAEIIAAHGYDGTGVTFGSQEYYDKQVGYANSFQAGQSFETSGASIFGWDEISFQFNGTPDRPATPNAVGHLFIAMSVSAGSSGITFSDIVAESTGIINGVYQFDQTFQLQPSTVYYAYTDAELALPIDRTATGGLPVGQEYDTDPGNSLLHGNFETFPGSFYYEVNGTPIPEPTTFGLFGLGGLGIALSGYLRRRLIP